MLLPNCSSCSCSGCSCSLALLIYCCYLHSGGEVAVVTTADGGGGGAGDGCWGGGSRSFFLQQEWKRKENLLAPALDDHRHRKSKHWDPMGSIHAMDGFPRLLDSSIPLALRRWVPFFEAQKLQRFVNLGEAAGFASKCHPHDPCQSQ